MGYSYLRLEKHIAANDSGSMWDRWHYGHKLRTDPKMATPKGHLQTGALAKLITIALKAGVNITEREIQYRLRCARTYQTEAEFRTICSEFKTWSDLRAAGFPPVDAVTDAAPYDPRAPHEKRDAAKRQIDRIINSPEAQGQEPLPGMRMYLPGFTPDNNIGRETLFREAFKLHRFICDEVTPQLRKAADRAERDDREREAKLNRMFDAVNRNLDASLGDGEDALLKQAPVGV